MRYENVNSEAKKDLGMHTGEAVNPSTREQRSGYPGLHSKSLSQKKSVDGVEWV